MAVPDQPLDLGAREVRVDDQPGALADQPLMSLLAELVAARGRAPILPDQGAMDRLAALRVPGHNRLALVGDADPGQVRSLYGAVGERRDRDLPRHLPDLSRVMLDPARLREVLFELAVRAAARPTLVVEDDAGGPSCPLVDRQDHRAGRYLARCRAALRMSRS